MNYDNNNTGVLFTNEKRRSDNSPDDTGSCEITCIHCGVKSEIWISAWRKVSRAGKAFISLAFTAKDAPSDSRTPQAKKSPQETVKTGNAALDQFNAQQTKVGTQGLDDFDDDIPF